MSIQYSEYSTDYICTSREEYSKQSKSAQRVTQRSAERTLLDGRVVGVRVARVVVGAVRIADVLPENCLVQAYRLDALEHFHLRIDTIGYDKIRYDKIGAWTGGFVVSSELPALISGWNVEIRYFIQIINMEYVENTINQSEVQYIFQISD